VRMTFKPSGCGAAPQMQMPGARHLEQFISRTPSR
jgi:hypothetical protein